MVSSTCLHLCPNLDTTCLTIFIFNGLTSSSSINPGIPVEALSHSCPILLPSCNYCYGNGCYPENQTGTRQGQEHIARLGIRIIPQ